MSGRLQRNNHEPLEGKAMNLRNILYLDFKLMPEVITIVWGGK